MNRAVEISVGSLSPTINWSALKMQEFDLPPLDQQRRIAEILWAIDNDEQQKASVAICTQSLLTAEFENELDRLLDGPCERLDNILLRNPESGCSAPPSPFETGHYVLSLASLSGNGYRRGNLKPIHPSKSMLDCTLSPGDFLISRSNTQELVGRVGIFDEERDDVSFPDTMMRLTVDEHRVNKRFLEAVLQSRRGRLHMRRSAAGTSGSMKKINRRTLGSCLIPLPALSVQDRLLKRKHRLYEIIDSANVSANSKRSLQQVLIESFFEGLQ